jgi:hypothetical protein
MKYWEIIADRLSKAGWSLGWVSMTRGQSDVPLDSLQSISIVK